MYIYIKTLCQKIGTACTKGTIPLILNTCGMLSVNDKWILPDTHILNIVKLFGKLLPSSTNGSKYQTGTIIW